MIQFQYESEGLKTRTDGKIPAYTSAGLTPWKSGCFSLKIGKKLLMSQFKCSETESQPTQTQAFN